VAYFILLCVQYTTQILLKKKQKQPFSSWVGVEQMQSVSMPRKWRLYGLRLVKSNTSIFIKRGKRTLRC